MHAPAIIFTAIHDIGSQLLQCRRQVLRVQTRGMDNCTRLIVVLCSTADPVSCSTADNTVWMTRCKMPCKSTHTHRPEPLASVRCNVPLLFGAPASMHDCFGVVLFFLIFGNYVTRRHRRQHPPQRMLLRRYTGGTLNLNSSKTQSPQKHITTGTRDGPCSRLSTISSATQHPRLRVCHVSIRTSMRRTQMRQQHDDLSQLHVCKRLVKCLQVSRVHGLGCSAGSYFVSSCFRSCASCCCTSCRRCLSSANCRAKPHASLLAVLPKRARSQ